MQYRVKCLIPDCEHEGIIECNQGEVITCNACRCEYVAGVTIQLIPVITAPAPVHQQAPTKVKEDDKPMTKKAIKARRKEWEGKWNKLPTLMQELFKSIWPDTIGKGGDAINWEAVKMPDELEVRATNWLINHGLGKPCWRCYGSGHYSFNPIDGTVCYGCWGRKFHKPAITRTLINKVREINGLTPKEENDMIQSVAFTGHRPQSIKYICMENGRRVTKDGFDETNPLVIAIKLEGYNRIKQAYQHGARHFRSGFALGFDMWMAEAVLHLNGHREDLLYPKEDLGMWPGLQLVASIPMLLQFSKWERPSINRWYGLLKLADEIEVQLELGKWRIMSIDEVTSAIQQLKAGWEANKRAMRAAGQYFKDSAYPETPMVGHMLQRRNERMVDMSDIVIACWNGTSGGTGNCVRYAESVGVPVEAFNPNALLKDEVAPI